MFLIINKIEKIENMQKIKFFDFQKRNLVKKYQII